MSESEEARPPLEIRLNAPSVHADLLEEEVPAESEAAPVPTSPWPPGATVAEAEQGQGIVAFV